MILIYFHIVTDCMVQISLQVFVVTLVLAFCFS